MKRYWKELKSYLVWKGFNVSAALGLLVSVGFLTGIILTTLWVMFEMISTGR
tara:strand:- start:930 stop:1085 length:156 start_codon:yes stop_codon:yes gene_type:complete